VPKPASPVWTPGEIGTEGCQGYWPLHEGSGTTLNDISGNGRHLSFVGTPGPTWSVGPLGAQLGGFSSSNYAAATFSPVAPSYPFWVAALVSSTTAINKAALQLGDQSTGGYRGAYYNSSDRCQYVATNNGSSFASVSATARPEPTDGLPHLIFGVEHSATDRRLEIDGVQVATSTTNLGLLSGIDAISAGLAALTGAQAYTSGYLIALAIGWGALPNGAALAADWLSGTFAAAGGGASPNLPAILHHLRQQGMA
jgi:hypothetical protein